MNLVVEVEQKKVCSKCGDPKSIDDFHIDSSRKDGHANMCKVCVNLHVSGYRKENRKLLLEKQKTYALGHKEDKHNYDILYYQKNKERINIRGKAYYSKNKESQNIKGKAYYESHKESLIESQTKYNKLHPEIKRATQRKRRAIKKSSGHHTLTSTEWEIILSAFKYRCAYCGAKPKRLEQDHITPLSKGGSHSLNNIVPACRSCNAKKSNKDPISPVQPLLIA